VKHTLGRGNMQQLLEWVTHWYTTPAGAENEGSSLFVGVLPDALMALQLKQALPRLSILTGDEAPGERKRLLNGVLKPTPSTRLVMSLREATVWLRQHPHQAHRVWTWGVGTHEQLGHSSVMHLLQPLNNDTPLQVSTCSRAWCWGRSVPRKVEQGLQVGTHRLIWVTLGLRATELLRVKHEVETSFRKAPQSHHIMLDQHTLWQQHVEQAVLFLQDPTAQVVCCDATVFSCLTLPKQNVQGECLAYHVILESRKGKQHTLPEDVLYAQPWETVRHYTQEWWRFTS
jgi:hypothetical protein